ncbi:endosomal peripheral membrane protein [Aspergillus costaricaensis CBS 115574]|uniref:putative endosomal peripheral membrane protein (Mon2) n=1 Tax=Aspergillus costaricaensis CBS 115574 TaxID=1448317 RepID=UPI000DBDDDD7|nr:endosomal peripheral membrane protein [Aspergillus costaricaensis CBS 115574]RAK91505.1 endosomal peripheral membrane protein [Aspergillus costaricaensis CBS 115574]
MSSQFLQTELLNLIQESKRRNSELRNAAEESLNELKALPSTSEAQISADLVRKPKFANPFILACHSRHAKLAGIGVVCLQRLVASRSLPSERLKDVLAGLKETTNMSLDIQLKILQSLPSLLQHYSSDLGGDLLVSTLEICATLQGNKMLAVSSTAAATLQQLIVSTFDRVSIEDKNFDKTTPTTTVKVDGNPVNVGYFAYDALRVLDDLCRLIDGEPLYFLRIKSLSSSFTLELIESILVNSGKLFVVHSELTQILRVRLMPLIVRYLSERHSFSQTVRVSRILLVLLKRHMSLLPAECEMALGLLTHLLEPDGNSPWKRVLCMEVFRGLYAEPGLVRLMYSLYDRDDRRKNILKDHMASLVRLTSEKPTLIGVSSRSTVPSRVEHARSITEEQITLEAGGVAGVIGTTVPSTDTDVPGISSQWSVVRTPYMELLDKTDPPTPPDTYIYSLVLNCIGSFAEGLAKFILPLTVPDLKQKRRSRVMSPHPDGGSSRPSQDLQRTNSSKGLQPLGPKKSSVPINPLLLESHPQLPAIQSCAGIIETCWPAILAACSTFLYASLDDDFYHNLVRSIQKLAHVAGLLRLSTPRDALLTTIGKAAMPADATSTRTAGTAAPTTAASQSNKSSDEKSKGSQASLIGSPLPAETSSAPSDVALVSLSTRNLLCLRALLNLGIALGPTLDQPAWSIILGTLQDTDLVIGMASTKSQASTTTSGETSSAAGVDVPKANLNSEILAVQAASAKMLESTSEYPSDSFQEILTALLDLSGAPEESTQESAETTSTVLSPQSRSYLMRKNTHRVSRSMGKSKTQDELLKFVLEKANELARANLERFSSLADTDQDAWQLLTGRLMSSAADRSNIQKLRLRANEVLNDVVFQTLKHTDTGDVSERNARQLRNLQTLKHQVQLLYDCGACSAGSPSAPVAEVHEQSLETLKSILEQYAETFVDGWSVVFDLITSVFGEPNGTETPKKGRQPSSTANSPRLVRVAYKSLQLIASDFISLLPVPCRLSLVDSFSKFALQQQDFNISLTTTSSFWNVSDFLQGQIEQFCIEVYIDSSVTEDTLAGLAKGEDPSVSRNALWLLLLLRIVDLTTDSRPEIRNCAVQTLLRIFDAYGQQLSPKAWRLCLNRVLFRMVEEIETELTITREESSNRTSDDLKAWTETTVVMIKGASDLITTFFEPIVQDDLFDQSWERLLEYFRKLISLQLLEFSEAVYASLSNILRRVQASCSLSTQALRSAWLLWVDGHPADREDILDLERPNQDAAIAYLQSFQQIYRLYKDEIAGEQVESILGHIRLLAWNSISPPYSPDIDRLSRLQTMIIECLKTLCLEKDDSQPEILSCLADFADAPLTKWDSSSDSKRPTYLAFSKAAIDLLSWYIADHGIKKDIFTNGSLATTLEHLANPIVQRYEWSGKDREPSLWRKSTTASLNVLQVAIPYVETQYGDSERPEITQFWKSVNDIASGIVTARGYRTTSVPRATILEDESFDVAAFERLKKLIIPSLGASVIPDSIRRDFSCALLLSSFIYLPQRFDIPAKSLQNQPLKDIYEIRPGRTFEPPPTTRTKLAYAVIDTLFELASSPSTQATQATSAQQNTALILLARSITPYLILRCAVSLKGYIADQPLRGLMPQPTPARRSLLHLLRGMVDLRSEPSAIPPPKTAPSESATTAKPSSDSDQDHKKHLAWIYPLVVRAVQVAGKEQDDGEVLHALGRILQEVNGGSATAGYYV